MGYLCTSGYELEEDFSIPLRCHSYCEDTSYKNCKECPNIVNEEIIDKLNAVGYVYPITPEDLKIVLDRVEKGKL